MASTWSWAATNMTVKSTDLNVGRLERLLRALKRRLAPRAAEGARPVMFAATSPDVRGGDFIGPGGRFGVWGRPAHGRSSDRTYDQHLARRLWQVSESMTGVRYTFGTANSGVGVARSGPLQPHAGMRT